LSKPTTNNQQPTTTMRIAIIGAGPSGAMAAVRLARAGAEVLLFDPSHPREKPCGGGLTGRALGLVADVVDVASLESVCAQSAHVESPDGTGRFAAVPLTNHGATAASSLVVLSRAVFDAAMLDAAVRAGAKLIAEKVVAVSGASVPGQMKVSTHLGEHRVDFVLGADGTNSVVRKTFSVPFRRDQLSIAAGYFVHGATADAITIKSTLDQPGYLWSFPRADHLAVGMCTPAASRIGAGELKRQSLAWIRSHHLDRDTRPEPYAWPIPSVPASPSEHGYQWKGCDRCAGSGWMLLGDAAGLVDPLTREGIYYALLSGEWAAAALTSCSLTEAPLAYEQRIEAHIRPELARAAKLSGMFFTPAFSRLLVDALEHSESIRRIFGDLVAGTQPYRGLRRRLLATREWKLAGRAIRIGLAPVFTSTMKAEFSPRHSSTA
jgi:geranylgeranyl reductase family protein